jgi:hypothetical protein
MKLWKGRREKEGERERSTSYHNIVAHILTHAKGSLNVLAVERNHIVDGLIVSTLGGLPNLVKLPQGSPILLFTPF